MLVIQGYQLDRIIDFPSLINALREGLQTNIETPQRHHHAFGNDATLLLMPSWYHNTYLGIKLITACPHNQDFGLPTIQGVYILFNAETGVPIAQMDASVLTNYRTAAASALAASYLAPKVTRRFLMIGTGSLAPYLIKAHLSVNSFEEISIWGRSPEKAERLAHHVGEEVSREIRVYYDLESAVHHADMISVATHSSTPLVLGQWVKRGAHIDLVGSYKPTMREADDDLISKATVFVDTWQGVQETGDLLGPLKSGRLDLKDIAGSLVELCEGKVKGRSQAREITVFKSVGHASEDLIASILVYEKFGTYY